MKRGKKLLILFLVLVALWGLTWGITALTAEKEAEAATLSGEVIFCLEETPESIGWTYGENAYLFDNTDSGWVYRDNTAYPLDTSYMDAILAALAEVTAEKVIEDPGDLEQFGLAEPICSITVNENVTLELGNESLMGGQRYVCNGDGKVYLVDSTILDSFQYDLYHMVAKETIPDLSNITALTLTTEDETVQLTYQENSTLSYSDHYKWFCQDTAVDMEAMEALLSNLQSLSWSECIDFQAQGSSLATYGLDVPAATYELHYTTEADSGQGEETGIFTIQLGDGADDEYCYAMLPGSCLVYLIDFDLCAELIAVSSQSLLVDDVLRLDTETLQSVDIELDGENYSIEKVSTETTDEDGNTTEETAWMLGDTALDIPSVLETLNTLTGTNTGSAITPERGQEIRFTFHRNTDTFQTIELIFYQYDGSNCLVSLNGETSILAPRADVVSIIEAINALVL